MTDKAIVYVVDDDDAVRRSVGFMLKTSGFDVHAFASGIAFLKEVKTLDPGCVLLDVRMPEMDGLEVQQELNAQGIAMPVIVLTGHGDVATAVQARNGARATSSKSHSRRRACSRRSSGVRRRSAARKRPPNRNMRPRCELPR